MGTTRIRYYYASHATYWAKLEVEGTIAGPQRQLLASWNRLKATNPDMTSMEVTGDVCYPVNPDPTTKDDAHAG